MVGESKCLEHLPKYVRIGVCTSISWEDDLGQMNNFHDYVVNDPINEEQILISEVF